MTESSAEQQALSARRLNVGCGEHPLAYWTNLDMDRTVRADVYADVPPLPFPDRSMDEIYAGHFLEHLDPDTAKEFLNECYRVLVPGGRLGVVVPDTYEAVKRYLRKDVDAIEYPRGVFRSIKDMDTLCELFFYSTVQASGHKWSYDSWTLQRTLRRAGFDVIGQIDRYKDPRIPVGAWYQCGLDARRPL